MVLNKISVGDLIKLNNQKNDINLDLPFYGINKDKLFMPTVADTNNLDRKKYKIIKKGDFVFSGMQTGRDLCIRIGLYSNNFDALISPAYTTFGISSKLVIPEYLFMLFKSSEMDRYGAFLSDGSIRSNLDWNVFCDIEVEIPSLDIQQKYVDIYLGLKENFDAMTRSVDQLHLACDVYIENLLKTVQLRPIGNYIEQMNIGNQELKYGIENVRGISTLKEFIITKANMNGVSLNTYKVVVPESFAYVADTSRRGDKISLAYNNSNDTYLVSSITTTFKVVKEQKETLLAEYLFLFLRRPEFDRYARYNSWGSARETIEWEDLCRLEIPIPPINIQQDVVNIFNAYNVRRQLVDKLADLQKKICPVLVKGANEEGGR